MVSILLLIAITGYISSAICILALVLSLVAYIQKRQLHEVYMVLTWVFLGLWSILATTSHIVFSADLYRISFLFILPMLFSIIFLSDSISRERVDTRKIAFASFFSAAMIIFSFDEGSVVHAIWSTGETTLRVTGAFTVLYWILGGYSGFLLVFYMTKVYKHAPPSLKKDSLLGFTGSILAGILMPLFSGFGLVDILIGSDFLLLTIGAFLMTIGFIREPRLAYILPFKAERLLVLETRGGIPLYSHTWDTGSNLIDEDLFSGMIQGVSVIVRESINKGDVQEIKIAEAILLMKRDENHPVICVLVANKASKFLRDALDGFAKQFFKMFSKGFNNPTLVSQFYGASKLVEQFFPFVPKYG